MFSCKISHRCGLQLDYTKKVMTSGQHSAAHTPLKFRLASTGAKPWQLIVLYNTGLGPLYALLILDSLL